jgi:multidrug efflux pump subunit AcrB
MAGRLAAAFLDSRLTPLLTASAIALGAFAVVALPREEEPQIVVPMIDVMVAMPGASPAEVERRVTAPLERLLWEVPGVEYLYATSSPGRSMIIVRFLVGHDEENALVRLNQKIDANLDLMPPGVSPPLVKPRSIDDVPILALTLWSDRYDGFVLRQVAAELQDAIKQVPNVSEVAIVGGERRELSVVLDPARLGAYGVDPLAAREALRRANVSDTADAAPVDGASTLLEGGDRLRTADEVGRVVVGGSGQRPVRLRDLAEIRDGDAEPAAYVTFSSRASGAQPAVTVTVAKRAGTNAIDVVHAVERKLAIVRGTAVPADVQLTVTRNYGETSAEKSNELLFHMLIAVLSVSLLIWIALGRREAAVVLVAIPVTLALTLFVFYLYGYTLNRITLFALIFSIGILVDDAIVVVENVVRHARLASPGDRKGFGALAIRAVDEVGNPTILATLTVVAAILPMAFVGGLMGPYMRPIPVGATAAMLFSLVVAFVITPWAAVRLLRRPTAHHDERENRMTALYRRVMGALIRSPRTRWAFLGSVAALLVLSVLLVPLKLVTVKMLPFDNKSEFQVVVNMPEGTPLERTAQVAATLAQAVLEDPAVTSVQAYSGTASPYNFNGLVRHYFLRQAAHQADLQVNLLPRDERDEQSHAIARRVRDRLSPIAAALGARLQVAEVPPGPPVLQTMVAEVYGPDPGVREQLAGRVRDAFRATPGVVDVDWYVEERQPKVTLTVDHERAAAAGVSAAAVSSALRMAGSGEAAGLLHDDVTREDVPIVLRLPRDARDAGSLQRLRIGPRPVAIGELTEARTSRESASLYRKNLQPVTYVTADLAGAQESPVYAILQLDPQLRGWTVGGKPLETFSATQPFDTGRYAVKWDGEWHITYEVFRDLGFAFAAVLILIYLLVVGWFQSFSTPVAIMAAIPFSLVGILPAHAAMGAFFTATSMIGFIAGAGIVVRNSIILVDFIELRLREGLPLAQAVVDAGAVRFRPMALTAAAVIVGSAVILFDPIFQGLAIALMAGEVASLLLSRMTVPVLYYLIARRRVVAPVLAEAV